MAVKGRVKYSESQWSAVISKFKDKLLKVNHHLINISGYQLLNNKGHHSWNSSTFWETEKIKTSVRNGATAKRGLA